MYKELSIGILYFQIVLKKNVPSLSLSSVSPLEDAPLRTTITFEDIFNDY